MSEHAAVAAGALADTTGNVVSRNPNASVALGSGSGLGALVIWLIGLSGTQVPPEIGAAIGGAVAAVFLFVGRRGIKGAVLGIWRGEQH
jgi:hypothetical protein